MLKHENTKKSWNTTYVQKLSNTIYVHKLFYTTRVLKLLSIAYAHKL
jgi:hypothetical protein